MIALNSFAFQLHMHPVHKLFGVLLTISGAIHLYFNFGAIKTYLGTKKVAIFSRTNLCYGFVIWCKYE